MKTNEHSTPVWAVIGGGNGGQSAAAHLGTMGYRVRLFDVVQETIDAIAGQGGIHVSGAVEGFGPVEVATTDMVTAVSGADVIMVILPAIYHRAVAEAMAPHLAPGQVVFIHPGATFGALEFRQVFRDAGTLRDGVVVSEAQSLLYACRVTKPGNAAILGKKQQLAVGAVPASQTDRVVEMLKEAFPEMYGVSSVLETSFTNLNAMMHPAPSLLNVGRIESQIDWEYYMDGITPSIGRFVQEMDKERIELGKVLGLTLKPVLEMYHELYGVEADTLSEAVKKVSAYKGIAGQKRLDTRYVLEDIPTGLVPMSSAAEQFGVEADRMATTCKLANYLIGKDITSAGRTMSRLGIGGMSPQQLVDLVSSD